jgi:hypothetical protein
MGFFKDINRLNKQAKEIDKTWDPGAQMQQGITQMQAANAAMQQQTVAAQISATGTPAQLQITGSRDTGTVMNMQPLIELDVLVIPDGAAPYPTTVQQIVPMAVLSKVAPGATLRGKVDPATPSAVWIDWTS